MPGQSPYFDRISDIVQALETLLGWWQEYMLLGICELCHPDKKELNMKDSYLHVKQFFCSLKRFVSSFEIQYAVSI